MDAIERRVADLMTAAGLGTVAITVRNAETGVTAEHHVYNQTHLWTEAEAREWVGRTEYDPWEYASHRHE